MDEFVQLWDEVFSSLELLYYRDLYLYLICLTWHKILEFNFIVNNMSIKLTKKIPHFFRRRNKEKINEWN